jgi:hypothetical protein
VVAGDYAATIFAKPSAKAIMRDLDRKFAATCGVTDYPDRIDALRVDVAVADGDVVKAGDMTFEAIALPGHTKCSMGFYLREERSKRVRGFFHRKAKYTLWKSFVSYLFYVHFNRRVKKIQAVKKVAPARNIPCCLNGNILQAETEYFLKLLQPNQRNHHHFAAHTKIQAAAASLRALVCVVGVV